MNPPQPDTTAADPVNNWNRVGATPVSASVFVDNRSEDEKAAQARLLNAQAKEKEQENLLGKLKIGAAYAGSFGITLLIGFIAGRIF